MYTLIGLSDGIYLETSKARLHWGISREQAWQVGNPRKYQSEDDTRILWEEKILGGLSCNLLVHLPDNAVLDRINIWFNPPGGGLQGSDALLAAYDYVTAFTKLVEYFGPPKKILPPLLVWKHDGCIIRLGISNRFEDCMRLAISKGIKDDENSLL